MKRKKLGEVLQERGKISTTELRQAMADHQNKSTHLGEILLARGLVAKADIATALEEVFHFEYVDCLTAVIDRKTLDLIPRAIAERCSALPLRREGAFLVVAMAEPQNLALVAELRFTTGLEISPRVAFRSEVREAIRKYYLGGAPDTASASGSDGNAAVEVGGIEFISTSSRQNNQEAMQEMQADLRNRKTPAVVLVSETIQAAVAKGASDVHIEPQSNETAIRIRVDGVLRDFKSVPRAIQNSLISRIKILADMDIAERRTPQDGRFMVNLGQRQIDLRVSTLPTQYGEKIVMRLLDSSAQMVSFSDVGMPQQVAAELSGLLSVPQGMVLVTGPTGSGKSTTLYSALNLLRKPSVNIVTVEDPVEYVLPGINQSHVNTKAGLTFASCLRSILRQDPNIIMVGEIRDVETAEIAMKAAQTGHLVLSTLHTNDSVSAIVRLQDLGIASFLISSSLTAIVAQRLVRKLCSCHGVRRATREFRARLTQSGVAQPPETMPVPVGCALCDHTGYKGRVGIFELLRFDESVRAVVRNGGRSDQVWSAARAQGMRTMQDDAIEKLGACVTSLDEILRVISFEEMAQLTCVACDQNLLPGFRFCPYCGVPCEASRHARRTQPNRTVPEKSFSR